MKTAISRKGPHPKIFVRAPTASVTPLSIKLGSICVGIEMGRVQMWIDMFPTDLPMPGDPVNIEVRKPLEYELRVIIWNTEDILPDETNVITGEQSSDIYIKGWLEGNREDIQVIFCFR